MRIGKKPLLFGMMNSTAEADEVAAPAQARPVAETTFRYEGYDLITLERLFENTYTVPEPRTAEELIGYYARRSAEGLKLPAQFAEPAPKAFGAAVDLSDPIVIKAMNRNAAAYVVAESFGKALRPTLVEGLQPTLQGPPRRLSAPPFPFSRPTTCEAAKCIYNLVPCENEFERTFARFLQGAGDAAPTTFWSAKTGRLAAGPARS